MGLLDELEQEAQRRKADGDDTARLRQLREEAYRTRLEPGMAALYEYLARLTQNLAFLKPKKTFAFSIPGYGEVHFQIEYEYDLKLNSQPAAKEIRLSFPCSVLSDECPIVEIQTAAKVKAVMGAFQRSRLAGLQSAKKDATGEIVAATFRARGKITATAVFTADAESGMLRMAFTNFDQLGGSLAKAIAPEQFTEELYDEIGRQITHEPNGLFREALPEDYRQQLRSKVQQEELRRKWEIQLAERQREELARLARENSLAGRVGRWLGQVKDSLLPGRARGEARKDA